MKQLDLSAGAPIQRARDDAIEQPLLIRIDVPRLASAPGAPVHPFDPDVCAAPEDEVVALDQIGVERDGNLMQVGSALREKRLLAHALECRKEKRDEDGNDANDGDQFDEREA